MEFILPETRKQLTALYTESHRHYHNIEHIEACLGMLNRYRSLLAKDEIFESRFQEAGTMIWFHDAIYDVGPDVRHGENELRSAEVWEASEEASRLLKSQSDVISDGIMRSAAHTTYDVPFYASQAMFLDIDLSSMGGTYSAFEKNGDQIRKEYEWVDDKTFNLNRAKFFETLLARPFIYYTHIMRGMLEESTRDNIKRWLRKQ
jgi:Uncharacterized protein conserved in bacteria